jgi:hypothetical protein
MWWKMRRPSLGLKDKLETETFAEPDFSSRFDIILSAPPSTADYMTGNLCIAPPQVVPSFYFKISELCESPYQSYCSNFALLSMLSKFQDDII